MHNRFSIPVYACISRASNARRSGFPSHECSKRPLWPDFFSFFFNPWQLSRPCRQPFSPHPNIVPESISLLRIGIKDRVHPDLPESCFPARSMQGITTHDSLHSRNSPFLVLLSSVGPGVQICIRLRAVFFFTILDSCSMGSHPTPVPQHLGLDCPR